MLVRNMTEADVEHVARLWWQSWHAAHAHILPDTVVKGRGPESFWERSRSLIGTARVAVSSDNRLGFHVVREDQVVQLYVAPAFWKRGVGHSLLGDAEESLLSQSHRLARLGCYRGNNRAHDFYQRRGWRRTGTFVEHACGKDGQPIPLAAWRYEKQLLKDPVDCAKY
ncbi:MAG: GNAT family N-acetyltransferase [Methyloceanibacter sp.]|nr:GNAT family N-acetyltransferase [Methyloceanibacter sp.]